MRVGEEVYILADQLSIEQFSLTCPAAMQINCNKRKCLHKKRVQLPQYWFGTQTWPPFQCVNSRTLIWLPWCHVKMLNHLYSAHHASTEDFLLLAVNCFLYLQQTKFFFTPVIQNRNCLDSFCPPISQFEKIFNLRLTFVVKVSLPNWSVNFTSSFQHNV